MRNYPDLRIAFSEGGIGWIPFYLDRCDRHYTNQKWLRRDFGGRLPSEVFQEHSLACYVTDPTSLKLRRRASASTSSPGSATTPTPTRSGRTHPSWSTHELAERRAPPTTEIDKITWQNACRFFDWDPFAAVPREQATVGALRAQATDVDMSIRSRKEWAALYAERTAG